MKRLEITAVSIMSVCRTWALDSIIGDRGGEKSSGTVSTRSSTRSLTVLLVSAGARCSRDPLEPGSFHVVTASRALRACGRMRS
ncbi:hypothetical protein BV20DRAFT_210045 [Pilatotrama ljubarskyi]|nr:hypothetical protein BV20DRAFT_210045 [Pilatotrama ljubarskyi]